MSSPAKLKVEHCFNLYHHECEIRAVITNLHTQLQTYCSGGISGGAHLSDQVPLMRLEWQI